NADEVMDDHYFPPTNILETRPIPWRFETNTMGANRAHNAWAHLQNVRISLGNFYGSLNFGVKGVDVNGFAQDFNKIVRQTGNPSDELWPRDEETFLAIRRYMKEWVFYGNNTTSNGKLDSCFGQFNFAQFFYTQATPNVEYEEGAVETFEYGRSIYVQPAPTGFGQGGFGQGGFGG